MINSIHPKSKEETKASKSLKPNPKRKSTAIRTNKTFINYPIELTKSINANDNKEKIHKLP